MLADLFNNAYSGTLTFRLCVITGFMRDKNPGTGAAPKIVTPSQLSVFHRLLIFTIRINTYMMVLFMVTFDRPGRNNLVRAVERTVVSVAPVYDKPETPPLATLRWSYSDLRYYA